MKEIYTKEAPDAIGPYSQGYICNGMIFLSGQVGVDPVSRNIPEGIKDQTRQACVNVGTLLKAAGVGYENVIKTTCFLADMSDFKDFNNVYESYFVSKPARSCVAVKSLPNGVLCEIEAIAVTEKA